MSATATSEALAVYLDGSKWKATYRTASGFRHVLVGNVGDYPTQADAERAAGVTS